jgi:hypothetical protein
MKRFALAASALMLAAAVAPAASASGNWLIGKWRYTGRGFVDSQGFDWCSPTTEVIFTPTTKTSVDAATPRSPAARSTQPVYYLAMPTKVYVSSTQAFGSAEIWDLLKPGEMQTDAVGHCVFDRE